MATGLETFAVACSVMQTIQFVAGVVTVCKKVRDGKSPAPELESRRKELHNVAESLQNSLKDMEAVAKDDDRELQRVAGDLVKAADDLEQEMGKYKGNGRSSQISSFIKTIKYMFRKSKIEKLDKKLMEHKEAMETRILIQLKNRSDFIQATLDTGLAHMDDQLENFLWLLKDGNTQLAQLIDQNSGSIRTEIHRGGAETKKALQEGHTQLSEQMEENSGRLQTHVSQEGTRTREEIGKAVVSESDMMRSHITSELDDYRSNQARQAQIANLLASLKFPTMNARMNASAINQSHEGTFQWIFKDPRESDEGNWDSFTEWLSSGDQVYWISGKPGSGKSSLIRYLTTNLRTETLLRKWSADTKILDAFIWIAGEPIQRNPKGVLATLIHQLIFDDHNLVGEWNKTLSSKSSIVDWSLPELENLLLQALKLRAKPTCIFIDGLDELDQEHNGWQKMLKLIKSMSEVPRTKLCLGSRPELAFNSAFADYPKLRVQDLTRNDMMTHVTESLKETKKHSITDDQLSQLATLIVGRADGVFLWVNIVTRSVCSGLRLDEWPMLVKRVNRLPKDLAGLYTEMWNRLNEDDRELHRAESAMYFRMMLLENEYPTPFVMSLCAKPNLRAEFFGGGREITLDILFQKIQLLGENVLARGAGLLEFSTRGRPSPIRGRLQSSDVTVTFIHRSASDFLRDTVEGQQILRYDKSSPAELTFWLKLSDLYFKHILVAPNFVTSKNYFLSGIDIQLQSAAFAPFIDSKYGNDLLDFIQAALPRSSAWRALYYSFDFQDFAAYAGYDTYIEHCIGSLPSSFSGEYQRKKNRLLFWLNRQLPVYVNGDVNANPLFPQVVSTLLGSGADGNSPCPDFDVARTYRQSFHTAFASYLLNIYGSVELQNSLTPSETVAKLLKTLFDFLDHGSRTDAKILVQIQPHRGGYYTVFGVIDGHVPSMGLEGEAVLVEIDVWELACYVHTELMKHVAEVQDLTKPEFRLKALESKSMVCTRAVLITYIVEQDVRSISRTPDSCHIFDAINDLSNKGLATGDTTKESLGQVLAEFPEQIMDGPETIDWLVENKYLPNQIKEMTLTPKDKIYFSIEKDEFFTADPELRQFDWSYKPEYDRLAAAVKEYFGPTD
ncbi:hypothetical protein CC80DRAFT_531639 [Byssothecium circinans]|uniref:Nephrocystin 3-like N-terminal domain-containing protein n=1 Tax=Byssothecium circinans TaxID=147558 RepID=A0A6A5UL96_9PLEO|nr:hypothetical protein CC80DRAFT_531639 [Byssothecium circinans]